MKVVAINGSPHVNGNTAQSLRTVLDIIGQRGIETEMLQVGNAAVKPCNACKACASAGRCVQYDDDVNMWIEKMEKADAIILGSPVYFAGIASPMKSFLDRAFYVCTRKGTLKGKIGAALVAVRRSGGSAALDNLTRYLTYSEMLVSSGSYWAIIHGQKEGEAQQDLEGKDTLEILAENIIWAINLREVGKFAFPYPMLPTLLPFSYMFSLTDHSPGPSLFR